ncbi:MAG: ATP-binding protein [Deltaproteobacteria bacterium]|jgi:DNA replication protein DnaC|nr:ATP-binding protein [Deltaproteobacteria bacterium]
MLKKLIADKFNHMGFAKMHDKYLKLMERPGFNPLVHLDGMPDEADSDDKMYRWSSAELIRRANFPKKSSLVQGMDYNKLDDPCKEIIESLEIYDYVSEKRNIILVGPKVTLTNFIAVALGINACKLGIETQHVSYRYLTNELFASRIGPDSLTDIRALRKIKLLVVEDWLNHDIFKFQLESLYEFVDQRKYNGITIFSTRYPIESWVERLGNPVLAQKVLDIIVPRAEVVKLG